MGLLLGHRPEGVEYAAPDTNNLPPGKRTRAEQLAGQVHADMRQVCDERDGAADAACFLAPRDRARVHDQIRSNILLAKSSWETALVDRRLLLLTTHKDGWGALWKVAALVAMGALTEGMELGMEALAEAVESVAAARAIAPLVNHQDAVLDVLEFAGDQVVERVKDTVDEGANESGNAAADFLVRQLDGPGQWASALLRTFPKRIDDAGALVLLGLTDQRVMSVSAFGRQIQQLLARWQAQAGDVGEAKPNGRVQTVAWVWPRGGGAPRLASVLAWSPPTTLDRDNANNLRAETFLRWVDDDMAGAAVEAVEHKGVACSNMVTLDHLAGAPADDQTRQWDRGTASAAALPDAELDEQHTTFSHEEP